MPARRKPSRIVRAFWYLALALAVGAFLFQLMRGSVKAMEVGQVARAYVALVRQDKLDAAYALLSPETRKNVPRGAFSGAPGNPEIRSASSISFTRGVQNESASQACLTGQLEKDQQHQHVDVFLRREAGAWRVVAVRVYEKSAPPGPWPCGGH